MISCPHRYSFEGELLTIAQISALIPALSKRSIRDHLAAGRNTTTAMLSYRRTQPKPQGRSHIRIKFRLPHAFGGPAPTAPRRIA